MSKKQITVKVTSGTSTGPYNVYKTSVLKDNLLEENISLSNMQSGRTYRVDSSVTQVIIVNGNNDCCCSSKILSV